MLIFDRRRISKKRKTMSQGGSYQQLLLICKLLSWNGRKWHQHQCLVLTVQHYKSRIFFMYLLDMEPLITWGTCCLSYLHRIYHLKPFFVLFYLYIRWWIFDCYLYCLMPVCWTNGERRKYYTMLEICMLTHGSLNSFCNSPFWVLRLEI